MTDDPTTDDSTDDSYPDPAAAAREVARAARDTDSPGVARDTLMDAHVDAGSYAHTLQSMHVHLDGVADNLGLLPPAVQRDLREAQAEIAALAEWAAAFERELRAERDELGA